MKELYKLASAKDIDELERRISVGDIDVRETDDGGRTVLMELVRNRMFNRTVFDTLLRLGVDVNAADNQGKTALMFASGGTGMSGASIYKGSRKHASYLVSKGAKLGLRDKHGRTALGYAIRSNKDSPGKSNEEMVKHLKKEMLAEAAMRYFSARHSFSDDGVLSLELPEGD